ncbi:MAG: hypothetical protein ACP6IP_07710 [Candidatus Njordarchaeia archaeon]
MTPIDQFIIQLKYDMYIIFLYIWLLHPIYKIANLEKNEKDMSEEDVEGRAKGLKINSKRKVFFYITSFIIGSTVISYRYIVLPSPQGFDIPFYIYWAKYLDISTNKIGFVQQLIGRIASILFLKAFYLITGNYMIAVITTTLFFAGFFTGGIYLLASELKDDETGLIASILTSFTFAFYRLFLDLMANQIAWSFMPYALLSYIKSKKGNKAVTKWHIATIIFLGIMALSHIWSTTIFAFALLLDLIITTLKNPEDREKYYIYYIIFAAGFIGITAINPMLVVGILGFVAKNFLVASNKLMFVDRENLVIIILSILGVYTIVKGQRKNSKSEPVYFLYVVLSIMLISLFLDKPYRLSIMMPLGLLSAYSYSSIKDVVYRVGKFRGRKGFVAFALVALVIISAPQQLSYINDHVATPSQEALNQLYWIKNHYGYNSSKAVVLVDKIVKPLNGVGWTNSYRWLSAIIGNNYYSGSIIDYLQGLPRKTYYNEIVEKYYNGYVVPPHLSGVDIIMPSAWYDITVIEEGASTEIAPGIYKLQENNLTRIMEYALNNVRYGLRDLYGSTTIIAGWGNYNFTMKPSPSGLNITLRTINPGEWFGFEIEIRNIIGAAYNMSHLVVKLDTNLDGNDTLLLRLDNERAVDIREMYLSNDTYTKYLSMPIKNDLLPLQHICFYIRTNKSDVSIIMEYIILA